MLQAQATKLEADIKNAVVISVSDVPKETISVGSKVKLRDVSSSDIFVYTVMDQCDADVDKGIYHFALLWEPLCYMLELVRPAHLPVAEQRPNTKSFRLTLQSMSPVI